MGIIEFILSHPFVLGVLFVAFCSIALLQGIGALVKSSMRESQSSALGLFMGLLVGIPCTMFFCGGLYLCFTFLLKK